MVYRGFVVPRSQPPLVLSFTSLAVLGCAERPTTDELETSESSASESSESESSDTGTDDTGELPSCGERPPGGGLPGPPVLMSASFEDDLVVRLTFSEPLASVDDVDPASFRISIPFYDEYYALTMYWDPMFWFCSSGGFCSGDYTEVVELGCAEDDPASLLLRLDIFNEALCTNLQYLAMEGVDYAIVAHFDAAAGMITDLDDEPLASIAEHWVMTEELAIQVSGNFANLPLLVPIPCP